MTIETLMSELSANELQLWREYYAIEPWGEYRADLRAGLSTSTLINAQSKRANLKPEDFILTFKQKKKKVDHGAMMHHFNAMARRHNKKLEEKEKQHGDKNSRAAKDPA